MNAFTPPPPPEPGTVTKIADGILWIRMPLPFALDHVDLWALEDDNGWTLVDTGMNNAATRDLWERLLAGPLAERPVTRIIATHFHPDHMGLAGWLETRCGAPLTATYGEWVTARRLWLDDGEDYKAHSLAHYRRVGFGDPALPPPALPPMPPPDNVYKPRISAPPLSYRRIMDGDVLIIGGRQWRVLTFGGHAPEHACLWCPAAGVLIAGDQILPRISPAIGVWQQEPEGDPIRDFLASLDRLAELPEDTLVLPSHDWPFRTLRQRCAELQAHHHERLERTLSACRQPASALQILTTLWPRRLDPHQTAFATAEALSHLNHLLGLGKLVRDSGPEGVWLYRAL